MGETSKDIDSDIAAVQRIDAVPTLLRVLCDTTGMGFAAVARVTDSSWTACAVQDDIAFGLPAGGQLDIHTTLCKEVRQQRLPVVISQASLDPVYSQHHTPRFYGLESYVSVPIILSNGEYFGNLCAIDRKPADLSAPRIVSMFKLFAELIALQLENDRKRELAQMALLDERAAGELREQFIAILGHDLRTPLASVSACAQLLERKSADPMVLTLSGRIHTSARRMSDLINDVLDFARGRLGSGIGVVAQDIHDLGVSLTAVVTELQDTHPDHRIASHIEIDRSVHCDRGRIQQLASNLLANALTHGAPDDPVTFSARCTDEELVLQVGNAGEPIPPDSLGKVFGPFWRRDTAAHRQGLGLGLHICSQIVLAHHGRLEVTSTAVDGTTFTARMPLNG